MPLIKIQPLKTTPIRLPHHLLSNKREVASSKREGSFVKLQSKNQGQTTQAIPTNSLEANQSEIKLKAAIPKIISLG